MPRIFLILMALALGACASSTPQTDSFLSQAQNLPPAFSIEGVPFIEQSDYYCGPATLAMGLQWAGRKVSVDEIARQVYTPGMNGSLQLDMITASRRQGMMAVPITGLRALMTEVSSGNPVIVFENLALSWAPTWHYAIVFGYDLPRQTVLMHSGPEAFKQWDIRKFERSWKLGDYWGLVVLPPGKLAATGDELAHEKAASALEQIGRLEEADKSYRAILQRWPKSLAAHIGLANIAYSKKDFLGAVKHLEQATVDHPTKSVAWHNLAIAFGAAKKKTEARRSARQALKLASPAEKPTYLENLKEWTD